MVLDRPGDKQFQMLSDFYRLHTKYIEIIEYAPAFLWFVVGAGAQPDSGHVSKCTWFFPRSQRTCGGCCDLRLSLPLGSASRPRPFSSTKKRDSISRQIWCYYLYLRNQMAKKTIEISFYLFPWALPLFFAPLYRETLRAVCAVSNSPLLSPELTPSWLQYLCFLPLASLAAPFLLSKPHSASSWFLGHNMHVLPQGICIG